MNKKMLYREALKHMLMTAEAQELGEEDNGYIYEKLLEKGYDEELISISLANMGLIGENVSQAYLDCFSVFNVDEEFRDFTANTEMIEELSEEIMEECESVIKTIENGEFYLDFPSFSDPSMMV